MRKRIACACVMALSMSLLLAACGEEQKSDPKVEHTYQDTTKDSNGFKGTIRKMTKSIDVNQEDEFMVYIFATSCAHCAKFKPVINEYAQKSTAMNIYAYDIDDPKDTDSVGYFYDLYGNDFEGTPTLLHIKDGKLVKEYIGEQELDALPMKTLDTEKTPKK